MADIVQVKREDFAYLVKLADWAAGQGFCHIEGIQDPDEWCYNRWDDTRPDGYSAEALAEHLTQSTTQEADNAALVEAKAKLKAAGFTDYGIDLTFRTDASGTFAHAYLYEDGRWRFQTGGSPVSEGRGKILHCIYTMPLMPNPAALQANTDGETG